jgi:peptidoglycan/xylan/chitin deacetylase (PgdA/CDA1 family)
MTFDDGNLSDYSVALPMLQRCGYTATFYITTDWIGRPGFLSKSDIRCLHDEGMEIGSHGHTHMYFDDMTTESLTEELTTSVNILSDIVGNSIGTLGAPGGRLHPHLGTIARKVGIKTIATSQIALLHAGTNLFAVPRVPVGHAITLEEFRKITGGDAIYYHRQKIRKAFLNGAKRLFGNKRYESLRAKLMSCF